MSTLAAPNDSASRNPFRSNPSTPNVTGNTPALAEPAPPPATTNSPERTGSNAHPSMQLDGRDLEVDEPPPYTPDASAAGDTILEQGPRRPFQQAPAPPRQAPASSPPHQNPHWARVQSHVTGHGSNSTGSGSSTLDNLNAIGESIFQQIRTTLNPSISRQNTGRNPSWSSYPGQGQGPPPNSRPNQNNYEWTNGNGAQPPNPNPPHNHNHGYNSSLNVPPPPPRHPASPMATSPTTSSVGTSDFARDFYASGSGSGDFAREESTGAGGYAPPAGPPPTTQRGSTSSSTNNVPDDGRPTTTPAVGHPLLKDGKLLVYPKNYVCEKCHNVGYKNADPLRPCKKCWNKYSKPFTGPLAYSFSSSSPASSSSNPSSTASANLQRPLPHVPPPAPPPIPPSFSLNPPPRHFSEGGYMTNHHGGFYTPPTGVHPVSYGIGRPAPGSVVYMAGDPRIGGRLCWRCNGKGNTSFLLLDRITCEVCGGVGRTFDQ